MGLQLCSGSSGISLKSLFSRHVYDLLKLPYIIKFLDFNVLEVLRRQEGEMSEHSLENVQEYPAYDVSCLQIVENIVGMLEEIFEIGSTNYYRRVLFF